MVRPTIVGVDEVVVFEGRVAVVAPCAGRGHGGRGGALVCTVEAASGRLAVLRVCCVATSASASGRMCRLGCGPSELFLNGLRCGR